MAPLQLKDLLEIFLKRMEFTGGIGFVFYPVNPNKPNQTISKENFV